MQQYQSKPYRQPSFFDVETNRERLETQLRAERFPVVMAKMARRAEEMHSIYQKPSYHSLSPLKKDRFNLDAGYGWDTEGQRIALMFKFGTTAGKEFDVLDYMQMFYASPHSADILKKADINLVAYSFERITKRGTPGLDTDAEEHLQRGYRYSYEQAVQRLSKLRQSRPGTIELSERFIDVFGATYVGNGHRCIDGNEGLNFLDGVHDLGLPAAPGGTYRQATQLSPVQEKKFVESIKNVVPLGNLPVYEKEHINGKEVWNADFNGWGHQAEAFLFTFKSGRAPTVGYLNRSFATTNGEGWLVLSAKRAEGLEKKVA